MSDQEVYLNIVITKPDKCDHTMMARDFSAPIRAGSQVARYVPPGHLLPVVIEVNPDFPPRLHRVCGCPPEDLQVAADGAIILPTISAADMGFEIGVGNPEDYPVRGSIILKETD